MGMKSMPNPAIEDFFNATYEGREASSVKRGGDC